MKKGNSKLMLLVGLLVVVGVIVYLLPTDATQSQSVEVEEEVEEEVVDAKNIGVDDDAPAFSVEMTSGETITLESLRGKVVLLNFWATWCPPCQKELTRVQKDIIDRYQGRDFVFIPISRGEERSTVESFLESNGYTFPVGLDTDQSIYNSYATEYIPRNYLINRHGVVVEATVGYEAEEFDELLQKIDMTLNAR
ncbi:MAG: TlpA disulfide reductase family protein [Rikenellaceae bacterium]